MEIYQSEEQQVEAIKKFWDDNGNSLIAGLIIGLSGFVGFNYYKDYQLDKELATSDAYQVMLESSASDNKAFVAEGEKFITEHGESSYASLTALSLAKEAANEKDWPKVESHLNTAIERAKNEGIKAIATTRLARVQVQQEQLDKALATLSSQLPASFKATVEEIKGDIYIKQGKKDLARNAYQAAIDEKGQSVTPDLRMKLNDLTENINLSK